MMNKNYEMNDEMMELVNGGYDNTVYRGGKVTMSNAVYRGEKVTISNVVKKAEEKGFTPFQRVGKYVDEDGNHVMTSRAC